MASHSRGFKPLHEAHDWFYSQQPLPPEEQYSTENSRILHGTPDGKQVKRVPLTHYDPRANLTHFLTVPLKKEPERKRTVSTMCSFSENLSFPPSEGSTSTTDRTHSSSLFYTATDSKPVDWNIFPTEKLPHWHGNRHVTRTATLKTGQGSVTSLPSDIKSPSKSHNQAKLQPLQGTNLLQTSCRQSLDKTPRPKQANLKARQQKPVARANNTVRLQPIPPSKSMKSLSQQKRSQQRNRVLAGWSSGGKPKTANQRTDPQRSENETKPAISKEPPADIGNITTDKDFIMNRFMSDKSDSTENSKQGGMLFERVLPESILTSQLPSKRHSTATMEQMEDLQDRPSPITKQYSIDLNPSFGQQRQALPPLVPIHTPPPKKANEDEEQHTILPVPPISESGTGPGTEHKKSVSRISHTGQFTHSGTISQFLMDEIAKESDGTGNKDNDKEQVHSNLNGDNHMAKTENLESNIELDHNSQEEERSTENDGLHHDDQMEGMVSANDTAASEKERKSPDDEINQTPDRTQDFENQRQASDNESQEAKRDAEAKDGDSYKQDNSAQQTIKESERIPSHTSNSAQTETVETKDNQENNAKEGTSSEDNKDSQTHDEDEPRQTVEDTIATYERPTPEGGNAAPSENKVSEENISNEIEDVAKKAADNHDEQRDDLANVYHKEEPGEDKRIPNTESNQEYSGKGIPDTESIQEDPDHKEERPASQTASLHKQHHTESNVAGEMSDKTMNPTSENSQNTDKISKSPEEKKGLPDNQDEKEPTDPEDLDLISTMLKGTTETGMQADIVEDRSGKTESPISQDKLEVKAEGQTSKDKMTGLCPEDEPTTQEMFVDKSNGQVAEDNAAEQTSDEEHQEKTSEDRPCEEALKDNCEQNISEGEADIRAEAKAKSPESTESNASDEIVDDKHERNSKDVKVGSIDISDGPVSTTEGLEAKDTSENNISENKAEQQTSTGKKEDNVSENKRDGQISETKVRGELSEDKPEEPTSPDNVNGQMATEALSVAYQTSQEPMEAEELEKDGNAEQKSSFMGNTEQEQHDYDMKTTESQHKTDHQEMENEEPTVKNVEKNKDTIIADGVRKASTGISADDGPTQEECAASRQTTNSAVETKEDESRCDEETETNLESKLLSQQDSDSQIVQALDETLVHKNSATQNEENGSHQSIEDHAITSAEINETADDIPSQNPSSANSAMELTMQGDRKEQYDSRDTETKDEENKVSTPEEKRRTCNDETIGQSSERQVSEDNAAVKMAEDDCKGQPPEEPSDDFTLKEKHHTQTSEEKPEVNVEENIIADNDRHNPVSANRAATDSLKIHETVTQETETEDANAECIQDKESEHGSPEVSQNSMAGQATEHDDNENGVEKTSSIPVDMETLQRTKEKERAKPEQTSEKDEDIKNREEDAASTPICQDKSLLSEQQVPEERRETLPVPKTSPDNNAVENAASPSTEVPTLTRTSLMSENQVSEESEQKENAPSTLTTEQALQSTDELQEEASTADKQTASPKMEENTEDGRTTDETGRRSQENRHQEDVKSHGDSVGKLKKLSDENVDEEKDVNTKNQSVENSGQNPDLQEDANSDRKSCTPVDREDEKHRSDLVMNSSTNSLDKNGENQSLATSINNRHGKSAEAENGVSRQAREEGSEMEMQSSILADDKKDTDTSNISESRESEKAQPVEETATGGQTESTILGSNNQKTHYQPNVEENCLTSEQRSLFSPNKSQMPHEASNSIQTDTNEDKHQTESKTGRVSSTLSNHTTGDTPTEAPTQENEADINMQDKTHQESSTPITEDYEIQTPTNQKKEIAGDNTVPDNASEADDRDQNVREHQKENTAIQEEEPIAETHEEEQENKTICDKPTSEVADNNTQHSAPGHTSSQENAENDLTENDSQEMKTTVEVKKEKQEISKSDISDNHQDQKHLVDLSGEKAAKEISEIEVGKSPHEIVIEKDRNTTERVSNVETSSEGRKESGTTRKKDDSTRSDSTGRTGISPDKKATENSDHKKEAQAKSATPVDTIKDQNAESQDNIQDEKQTEDTAHEAEGSTDKTSVSISEDLPQEQEDHQEVTMQTQEDDTTSTNNEDTRTPDNVAESPGSDLVVDNLQEDENSLEPELRDLESENTELGPLLEMEDSELEEDSQLDVNTPVSEKSQNSPEKQLEGGAEDHNTTNRSSNDNNPDETIEELAGGVTCKDHQKKEEGDTPDKHLTTDDTQADVTDFQSDPTGPRNDNSELRKTPKADEDTEFVKQADTENQSEVNTPTAGRILDGKNSGRTSNENEDPEPARHEENDTSCEVMTSPTDGAADSAKKRTTNHLESTTGTPAKTLARSNTFEVEKDSETGEMTTNDAAAEDNTNSQKTLKKSDSTTSTRTLVRQNTFTKEEGSGEDVSGSSVSLKRGNTYTKSD